MKINKKESVIEISLPNSVYEADINISLKISEGFQTKMKKKRKLKTAKEAIEQEFSWLKRKYLKSKGQKKDE